MNAADFFRLVDQPLRRITLAELQHARDVLAQSREESDLRLGEIDARKQALFADAVSRDDERGQRMCARQIAALEEEANGISTLVRMTHKQLLLLDRLIALRENLDRMERLQRDVPGLPIDWQALVDATEPLEPEERLDDLNEALEAQAPDSRRSAVPPTPTPAGAPTLLPLVVRVLDGGAIELEDGRRVRYIGVDAPSMKNALGQPDIGAVEARDANAALVNGQRVRLAYDDLHTDVDGAEWCYVYVGNRLVNADLIRAGVACYVNRYPNNRHAPVLMAAERDARRHRRGLWRYSS